jgi:hypothetical protein
MTDRLSLYNGALRILKERKLASLTENREPRRVLDDAWTGGAVDYCLEAGQWKFAMRSVALDASTSQSVAFGDLYVFDLPEDCKRFGGVFLDANMTQPFMDYRQEASNIYAALDSFYVRYVSNDPEFGGDMSLWTQRFVKFVEAHLAVEVALAITGDKQLLSIANDLRRQYKAEALTVDAMQDPSRRMPTGAWTNARNSRNFRNDGGSGTSLV